MKNTAALIQAAQVGDHAYVQTKYNDYPVRIARITPTGRIVVKSGNIGAMDRTFKPAKSDPLIYCEDGDYFGDRLILDVEAVRKVHRMRTAKRRVVELVKDTQPVAFVASELYNREELQAMIAKARARLDSAQAVLDNMGEE